MVGRSVDQYVGWFFLTLSSGSVVADSNSIMLCCLYIEKEKELRELCRVIAIWLAAYLCLQFIVSGGFDLSYTALIWVRLCS
jgi:hypothetical protein